MQLILNNNTIIEEPIEHIIYELKREANWNVFKDIQNKGDYLRVTCPFHKDGSEQNPSCSIYTNYHSNDVLPGVFHCFTCGKKGDLSSLVAHILDISYDEGTDWLIKKYGSVYDSENFIVPIITLNKSIKETNKYLDESILDEFAYYHPYLESRKINFEVAKKFQVGWNQNKNSITFPVWDEKDNLVMITERSIYSKKFYIPIGVEKPVYLLNYIKKEAYTYAVICESQINALTCWSYGIPAVALFGTGTKYQYDLLKKSGIRYFILCFDGDEAGRKGAYRFKKNMPRDVFIKTIDMPNKKDVNDLSKEEFINLLRKNEIAIDK